MTSPDDSKTSLAQRIERWIRPQLRSLHAYHVPDAAGLIKLDAMENPYTWPEPVVQAWLECLREVSVNRYPDAAAPRLQDRLREYMDVPAGMDILLGNGSDELIQVLQLALAGPSHRVLAPVPTFVMYEIIAKLTGLEFVGVPLGADFELDAEMMLEAVARTQPALIFLAYPNNPTGNLFDAATVDEIIRVADGLVIVDEAYHAFADASYMSRLGEFDNLLVMRTVSKLGLAGLRLGMLAGPPAWIRELDKVRLPYNINTLTQVSAEFALEQRDMLDEQVASIRRERTRLLSALGTLDGVTVFPTQANFVLLRLPEGRAETVFVRLRDRGILVKLLHQPGTALSNCLRITVGRPEENDAFLAALRAAINP